MESIFTDTEGNNWTVRLVVVEGRFKAVSIEKGESEVPCEETLEAADGWVQLSDGQRARVAKVGDDWWVHHGNRTHRLTLVEPGSDTSESGEGGLTAPMPGTVLDVMVQIGDLVSAGQTLLLMEAMKMEHKLVAPHDGKVVAVNCSAGGRVEQGVVLLEVEVSE